MVDLVAAGQSRRDAADEATRLYGSPAPETFRKHYRELESSGQLPKHSSHIDHGVEALKAALRQRKDSEEEARRTLSAAEEKARAIGLDLSRDLNLLFTSLRQRHLSLDDFLTSNPRDQADRFRRNGVTDADEAGRKLIEAHEERELLRQQLEALREVISLRSIVRQAE